MSRRDTDGDRLLLDTHVHTAASYDSEAAVDDVLAAARQAGLDGVVVTDHDTTANVAPARRAADDLLVVPGVEVSTADGHLLAIGVAEPPVAGRSLAATVAAIADDGGVAVVPHPFQRSRHGASRRAIAGADAVDGIEVWNAHTLTGVRNGQARRFAVAHEYPAFAGSDAHEPAAVGAGATEVRLPPGTPAATAGVPDVLAAMRAGDTRALGFEISPRRYVRKVVGSVSLQAGSLL